ncbi:MAG: FkbM family methyltransferase [Saprospiraceae bacterium]
MTKGDNFIDIGANIGSLTVLGAGIVGEKGKVISIEPHPRIFKFLEGNIKFNKLKNIKSYNVAVGESKGVLSFEDQSSDDQNKISVKSSSGLKVDVDLLDNLTTTIEKFKLLKIDVEGFELFVLKGAKNTLRKTEIVYFESWEKHFNNFDYSTGDVIKLLNDYGFKVFKDKKEIDTNYISEKCENLVARR